MAESSRKRRTSIGVLFWIAFILLVLVIFLANRSNIEQVLESTGIVEVVRDRFTEDADAPAGDEPANEDEDPADETPARDRPTDESEDRETEPRVVIGEPERSPEQAPAADPPEADATEDAGADEPATGTDAADETTADETTADEPTTADPERPAGTAQRQPSPDPEKPNRVMTGLYFIRVTDDGSGVDPEVRPGLFERPESGTGDHGYGLYLVDALCSQCGGDLELTETGADGTTFTVTLPRAAPPGATEATDFTAPAAEAWPRTGSLGRSDGPVRE